MTKFDYDREQNCPDCGEPLLVCLPCWLIPGIGEDDMEPDYEAEPIAWHCTTCEEHKDGPAKQEDTSCNT